MANARFNNSKGNQRNSDDTYDGEQSNSGMGEKQSTGGTQRDSVRGFGKREDVNEMSGTGARTSKQATYKLPTDQWRG